MVSRDATLQIGALAVGFSLLVLWSLTNDGAAGESGFGAVALLFGLGWTFVVLAGAHLYLAARGAGGTIPVEARWRFVGLVALVLVLSALAVGLTAVEPVLGVRPELPVYATIAGLVVGYFLFEAREGYRDSQRS